MRTTRRPPSPPPFTPDPLRATGHFAPALENRAATCQGCRRQVAAGSLIAWRGLDRCALCTLRALQAIPLPTRPPSLLSRSQRTIASQHQGRLRVW